MAVSSRGWGSAGERSITPDSVLWGMERSFDTFQKLMTVEMGSMLGSKNIFLHFRQKKIILFKSLGDSGLSTGFLRIVMSRADGWKVCHYRAGRHGVLGAEIQVIHCASNQKQAMEGVFQNRCAFVPYLH